MTDFLLRHTVRQRLIRSTNVKLFSGLLLGGGAALTVAGVPFITEKAEELLLFGGVLISAGLILAVGTIIDTRLQRIEECQRRQVEALHSFLDLVENGHKRN